MVRDQADFNALRSFGQQQQGESIWFGLEANDNGDLQWIDGTRIGLVHFHIIPLHIKDSSFQLLVTFMTWNGTIMTQWNMMK